MHADHVLAYEEGTRLVRHIKQYNERMIEGDALVYGKKCALSIQDFNPEVSLLYPPTVPFCVWGANLLSEKQSLLCIEHSKTDSLEMNIFLPKDRPYNNKCFL